MNFSRKCFSYVGKSDYFQMHFKYPGQRLQGFAENWQHLSASRTVLGLVRTGYKMKFAEPPRLTKPLAKFETKLPKEQMKVVRAEVAGFLEKKAIRIVPKAEAEQSLGFYSKLFCVPKPGINKWRMIIDLRRYFFCYYFVANFDYLLG